MLALKFHEAKALLLWVVILSHFLTGSFTYTCSPSYSAFTLLQANFWKMDICSQIPLSTTYRLSSGASVSCPTLTTMGGNNIHTNPLAQALCVKSVIPSIPIPYKDSSSSGCPGARMATTNEATTHQNAICATLLVSDIVDTSDGGSIRGSPFGICTVLISDPGSPGTDILCMEYTIEIEIVSSGELVCSSPCQTCSGTASFCLTCRLGFPLFYNNYCYSDCPSGSYQSSMNSCTSKLSKYYYVS